MKTLSIDIETRQAVSEERHFTLPQDAPLDWELFKAYNRRDVEAEMQIQEKLKKYPVPNRMHSSAGWKAGKKLRNPKRNFWKIWLKR